MRIAEVEAWTVGIPFRNAIESAYGVSYPARIRTIVRLTTDDGLTGLGETGPSAVHTINRADLAPRFLRDVAPRVVGEDAFHHEDLLQRLGWTGDAVAVEMACLDIAAKSTGRRLFEVLGGSAGPADGHVPVAMYAFFRRPDSNGQGAVTADNFVATTAKAARTHGFSTVKLKLGVHPPDVELHITEALRDALPDIDLRIDPNGAWSLPTALRAMHKLRDLDLEYVEDPIKDAPLGIPQEILGGRTIDIDGFRRIRNSSAVPLCADNCYRIDLLRAVIREQAADVVLADVFGCGGLRATMRWYEVASLFHLGLGMHSGTEIGIGQLAKLHVIAAMGGRVSHAGDAIYPEYVDDVLIGGPLAITDGAMALPTAPGLGAELDESRLARWELTADRHRDLDTLWADLKADAKVGDAASSMLVRQY